MKEETIYYQVNGASHKGFLVGDAGKRPGVLVVHAWRGQDDFAREKAKELADMGYVALAVDMYGDGKTATSDEEAGALMHPLFVDRNLVQERIKAAFDLLKNDPRIDPERIGAIGFCFGGMVVIELMRSGLPVRSVVSFHGVLRDEGAKLGIRSKQINGSILILHGYEDPLVSTHDIARLQRELNDAGADWEMNVFGHTQHAFTNPLAHDSVKGLVYNARSAKRAWQDMTKFFKETLG